MAHFSLFPIVALGFRLLSTVFHGGLLPGALSGSGLRRLNGLIEDCESTELQMLTSLGRGRVLCSTAAAGALAASE
jgi:hypothetical protein